MIGSAFLHTSPFRSGLNAFSYLQMLRHRRSCPSSPAWEGSKLTGPVASPRKDRLAQGANIMSRNELSRNAPCPCGSGKKYKHCCYNKGFEWQQDEAGSVFKSIPMNDAMTDLLEQQRQKFIAKYGREPGTNDPVFFDLPPVEQIELQKVQEMKKAGMDPAIIDRKSTR